MGVWGSVPCMNACMHMYVKHDKHDKHGCPHVSGHLQFLYMYTCVMVLEYLPLPAWSLSDSRQAQQGLDTDITTFRNWLSVLQMVAPRAAI